MGEQGREFGDEALVVSIHRQPQTARQVIFQLSRVWDRLAVLAHIRQGPGEQVGVALAAKAKDH